MYRLMFGITLILFGILLNLFSYYLSEYINLNYFYIEIGLFFAGITTILGVVYNFLFFNKEALHETYNKLIIKIGGNIFYSISYISFGVFGVIIIYKEINNDGFFSWWSALGVICIGAGIYGLFLLFIRRKVNITNHDGHLFIKTHTSVIDDSYRLSESIESSFEENTITLKIKCSNIKEIWIEKRVNTGITQEKFIKYVLYDGEYSLSLFSKFYRLSFQDEERLINFIFNHAPDVNFLGETFID